jgi:hypothetical protein
MLDAAQEELLAFTAIPVGHWKTIWTVDGALRLTL